MTLSAVETLTCTQLGNHSTVSFWHIVLKNSLRRFEKRDLKNSGLIERSIIDDRHLVDGLMTPEILPGRVSKEFFNTIDTFRSFEIPESDPSGRNKNLDSIRQIMSFTATKYNFTPKSDPGHFYKIFISTLSIFIPS